MTSPPETGRKITRETCLETKQKLVFYPDTMQEAEFIARQLLTFGFSYYNAAYANTLEKALDGCLYFDTDRTIMVNDKANVEGIVCTADSFAETFMPQPFQAAHPPNARLTLEDCLHGTLAFYPRSPAEAHDILKALRADGLTTTEPRRTITDMDARAVAQGLLVQGGSISFGPSAEALSGARICTAAELGAKAADTPPEQSAMFSAFNEMAARLSQLSSQMAEMAKRVEAIEKEVLPGTIDKPATPRKMGQP